MVNNKAIIPRSPACDLDLTSVWPACLVDTVYDNTHTPADVGVTVNGGRTRGVCMSLHSVVSEIRWLKARAPMKIEDTASPHIAPSQTIAYDRR